MASFLGGNHLALDFLNTRLVNAEGPVELLLDTAALGRWLSAVGLLKGLEEEHAAYAWEGSKLARSFLEELLVFRGKLRSSVLRFASGKTPEPAFLQALNNKLLAFSHRYIVACNSDRHAKADVLRCHEPQRSLARVCCFSSSYSEGYTRRSSSQVRRMRRHFL